jgi:hypothetical protein
VAPRFFVAYWNVVVIYFPLRINFFQLLIRIRTQKIIFGSIIPYCYVIKTMVKNHKSDTFVRMSV